MARLFGTDGVRGVANEELTPMLAMQLGQAGVCALTKGKKRKATIVVGSDTRISGDMLANALMAGICSMGADCLYAGIVPTPAVAYLTKKHKADAGVVISASHNPVEFNGIKFFDKDGFKLPDEVEDSIEKLIKENFKGIIFPTGLDLGKVSYLENAKEEYISHSIKSVPVDLKGKKIVVDCAEGASFFTSVEALKKLGADVVAIHNEPDGTNINKNCGKERLPISTTIVPLGIEISISAPIAAAIGSSIISTCLAPVLYTASSTARLSTSVTPLGTQTQILGLENILFFCIAVSINAFNILSVTVKSEITPCFNGRITSILSGVFPIICLALLPIAISLLVFFSNATTDG